MNFTELVYAIGDFFQATFKILPLLGNKVNWLFIIIGFVGMVYWLRKQSKYNKEAESSNTLK